MFDFNIFQGYSFGSAPDASQINPQVQQWFSLADKDGSGRISSTELQRVLANGQGGFFSDKACRLMIGNGRLLFYFLYT